MPLTIPVAHDFSCPQSWIGFRQILKLREEFDILIDWRAYELWPEDMEWPTFSSDESSRPPIPSRLDLQLLIEQIEEPNPLRIRRLRTHKAHEAVEFAKTEGVQDAMIEAFYRGHWQRALDIDDLDVIVALAKNVVSDVAALRDSVAGRRFESKITLFDDPAHAAGVFNVPTFFFSDAVLAEPPMIRLREKVASMVEKRCPAHRSYTSINMISTIDGKILSGNRDEGVQDLGSPNDKLRMREIEMKADTVLLGAQTLRATPKTWTPRTHRKVVVTSSGNIPWDHAYLANGTVAKPANSDFDVPANIGVIEAGTGKVDLKDLMSQLKRTGTERLLVLGGSELNAQLLTLDLVDEIFLTIAPKMKLGRDIPTIADGEPLDRSHLLQFTLMENVTKGDEIFLRYVRKRS